MTHSDIAIEQNKTVKLTPKQLEIHKGLKSIGEEIAAFYLDGIKIFNSNELETKSYLLAHTAREIEGGLRDILVVREKKEEPKCQNCNQIIKRDENKHITEICIALNVDENNPLAKTWHEVARKFHKFAHRHGVWKEPRDTSEAEKLWSEFEDILFQLVGTYYNLLGLVDRLLQYEKPSKEILETLSNLLQVEARFSYFFKSLNSIHWLKPLTEKGYFNPENNPKPQEVPDKPGYYTIPHWSVLDYLQNVANKNMEEPNNEITNTLIEIVNSIISYRDRNGERIDNYRTDWIVVKIISTFDLKLIDEQRIRFIGNALESSSRWNTTLSARVVSDKILPKIFDNKAKELALKLVDAILQCKKGHSVLGSDEYESLIKDYMLYDLLKKHREDILNLCGLEAAEVALDKINSIINEDDSQFNHIWIPTIENHPQRTFPDRYEVQLVDFVRDYFELTNPEDIRQKVKDLLNEDHSVLKRIAIHTINFHFNELNYLFWNWTDNPLSEPFLKHELYELLKKNCSSFSSDQIDKVLEWIDTKDFHLKEEVEKDIIRKQKLEAYGKREWLTALSKLDNSKVKERYEQYSKIDNVPIEHPGFYTWSGSRVGSISPIGLKELSQKSDTEISDYLKKFAPDDKWDSPSIEGLSEVFRYNVMENPDKFSSDLDSFKEVPIVYQHSLIWGFVEAWRARKTFDLGNALNFILGIIESKSFWNEENISPYNYRNWIISDIAELISEGTRDDDHSFNPDLLPKVEKILLVLAENTKSIVSNINNIINTSLNSPLGKVFSAMILFSLRYAGLYNKDKNERWYEPIKKLFDARIDRQFEPSLEFSVILGEYLRNLMYLDKIWVVENINKLFPKDIENHWEASFTGYLFYIDGLYREIYCLFRKEEHYLKAIKTDFANENATKHLVEHICIAYIEEWEKLDDGKSLIVKLLQNSNPKQVSEIVHFFDWRLRKSISEDLSIKIKALWKEIFEIASCNEEKPEFKKLFSNLSRWLCLVNEIDDDVFKWANTSARYVGEYFNTVDFIENLSKQVEKTPDKVGALYLEMLNNSEMLFDYPKDEVEKIVETLYQKGQKKYADDICNKYGESGYYFLKNLYKKYNVYE